MAALKAQQSESNQLKRASGPGKAPPVPCQQAAPTFGHTLLAQISTDEQTETAGPRSQQLDKAIASNEP